MNYAISDQQINKSQPIISISPVQMDLILTDRKTRHSFPLDPQPNINGVAREWKGKYYSMTILEMFSCITSELGFKADALFLLIDGARTVLVKPTKVKVDKLHLIEEHEAREEGVEKLSENIWRDYSIQETDPETKLPMRNSSIDTPVLSFDTLWIATHGAESYSANPYIVSFNFIVFSDAK